MPSPFLTPGPSLPPSLSPPSLLAQPLPEEHPPPTVMGSRASTLLRDEELEEIKKETGCEFGLGGGKAAGRLRPASVLRTNVAEVLIWVR